MNKAVQPILLILFVIIVPFLVYTFLQVKSLNDDEEMANTVYEKQMETVLFSMNQYADDMMSRWFRKLSNEEHTISIMRMI